MKKLILSLVALLGVTSLSVADTTSDLMGLGMPPALSQYVVAGFLESSGNVEIAGNLLPDTDGNRNLGAGGTSAWGNIFTDNITFTNSAETSAFSFSNDHELRISGGLNFDPANGALIGLNGVTKAAQEGLIRIFTGNNANGDLTVSITSTSAELKLQSNGTDKIVLTGAQLVPNFVGTMGDSAKDPSAVAEDDWIEVQISGTTYYIPVYAAS